ncbi:MAG: cobalamin-dependent protein [Methanomicrobiales archaeon]|jgi:methanogenic corrinoid protein MtbC1
METADPKEILSILLDFKGERVKEFCERRIRDRITPHGIFAELSAGLDEIGRGFEGKGGTRYFTSDLIVSGRNMKRALAILRPHFPKGGKGRGLVILGTVKGDVHDIGKMIFSVTLESNGFSCIDLGVDVDRAIFAGSVASQRPDILSLSALLSSTLPAMGEVIEELKRRGLREDVKVIVGGHAVTEEFAREIGADAYGRDAIDGLKKCLAFVGAGT